MESNNKKTFCDDLSKIFVFLYCVVIAIAGGISFPDNLHVPPQCKNVAIYEWFCALGVINLFVGFVGYFIVLHYCFFTKHHYGRAKYCTLMFSPTLICDIWAIYVFFNVSPACESMLQQKLVYTSRIETNQNHTTIIESFNKSSTGHELWTVITFNATLGIITFCIICIAIIAIYVDYKRKNSTSNVAVAVPVAVESESIC